jgi:surfactin synthase thioesterase subunit
VEVAVVLYRKPTAHPNRAFIGHCVGKIVSFHLAPQLRVQCFFLAPTRRDAPHQRLPANEWADNRYEYEKFNQRASLMR